MKTKEEGSDMETNKMVLTLAMATVNADLFKRCVGEAFKHVTGECSIVAYGNGCAIDESMLPLSTRSRIAHEPENKGVPYALHRLWELSRELHPDVLPMNHIVAYMHDDVFIHEDGWDERVVRAFQDPTVVLGGFMGSIGMASEGQYDIPYQMHHLARYGCRSNLTNALQHGEHTVAECPVSFVDGLSMILRRSLLDTIDGWSWWPREFVHHAYDYAIAAMVRRNGGRGMLIPVHCTHGVGDLNDLGGLDQTPLKSDGSDMSARYSGTYYGKIHSEVANKHGGDAAVHAASHRYVFDTFRDVLPLRLSENDFRIFVGGFAALDEGHLMRAFTFLTGPDRQRAAAILREQGKVNEELIRRALVV